MARRQGSSTSEQVERFSDESEGDNTPHVMDPVEESARLPESEEVYLDCIAEVHLLIFDSLVCRRREVFDLRDTFKGRPQKEGHVPI